MELISKPFMVRSIIHSTLLAIMLMLGSCSLIEPKRQRMKTVMQQTVPGNLLNTYWSLEIFANQKADCPITICFMPQGQFVFKFNDELYDGDYLWYHAKDTTINFHTRPLEKFAWVDDRCEVNPSSFALYMQGERPFRIQDDLLLLTTFDNQELRFKKVQTFH